MYKIETKNKIIIFTNKYDYDNYNDFLSNGLKPIRKDGRSTWFNDGSRLVDVTSSVSLKKMYVLHGRKGNVCTSERYTKKYVSLL